MHACVYAVFKQIYPQQRGFLVQIRNKRLKFFVVKSVALQEDLVVSDEIKIKKKSSRTMILVYFSFSFD